MNILRLLIGLFTGIGIVAVLCIIEQIVINIKNEIKDYRETKQELNAYADPMFMNYIQFGRARKQNSYVQNVERKRG